MKYFAVYAKNRITGETIIKKVNAETTEDATLKAKVTNEEYLWNGTVLFEMIADRVEMVSKGIYKFKQEYLNEMETWK